MDIDENTAHVETSGEPLKSAKSESADAVATHENANHAEAETLPNGKAVVEKMEVDDHEEKIETPPLNDATKASDPSSETRETSNADPTSESKSIAANDEEAAAQEQKPTNTLSIDVSSSPALAEGSHHSNGIGGSTTPGADDDDQQPAAELSPTLRRSTRTSALKALEKIRLPAGALTPTTAAATAAMVDSHVAENGPTTTQTAPIDLPVETSAASDAQIEAPTKKKRKLSSAGELDQFDCKFGIRLDPDGDVVMMTDGSEISSLNEEEAAAVRQKYREAMSREQSDATYETVKERELQVRDLEAALRLEEAKLAMLKKIRANQQLTARNENARRLAAATASITQNSSSAAAYKPPMATSQPTAAVKLNGSANAKTQRQKAGAKPNTSPLGNFQFTAQHQQILQKLLESGAIRPEQLSALLHSLNPAMLSAFTQSLAKSQQQQRDQQERAEREQKLREQQEKERRIREQQEEVRRKAAAEAEAARLAREQAQNTQQRIAAARTQLRRHLEQQLLQLPPPKAPVPDLSFVPNANQPDFLYLLGLDLVVQRNLKDKSVFKKVDFEPYVCEECGTDFTPAWKAISGDKGDLHLYCEQCVRQAQKRKVRHERTILYKKAFQKIAEQEKEFERQVTAGKFNESATSSAKDTSASSSTPASSKASNFNAAALSGLVNATKMSHSASSLAAAAAAAASLSGANRSSGGGGQNFGSRNQPSLKQETQKKPTPSTPASSRNKRPAASTNAPSSASSGAANNMASLMASLTSNPNAVLQMQQMLSAMRNNPMISNVLMSNPQMFAQFYAQMQQHQQQQQQQRASMPSSSATTSSSSNNAMSALLQAIAQSQGASKTTTTSSSSSSNHHHQQSGGHHASSHHQPTSHHHHQSSGSSSSASGAGNASAFLSQMNPALLQQLFAAAAQSRKK